MSWYRWRIGRLAWSSNRDGKTYDGAGCWVRVIGSVWILWTSAEAMHVEETTNPRKRQNER